MKEKELMNIEKDLGIVTQKVKAIEARLFGNGMKGLIKKMDEVMEYVDKPAVGKHLAGDVDFNERYGVIVDKFMETGSYMGHKIDPAFLFDPMLKYRRDAFWFQQLQLLSEMNPNAVAAFFTARPDAMELFKMVQEDMLDDDLE